MQRRKRHGEHCAGARFALYLCLARRTHIAFFGSEERMNFQELLRKAAANKTRLIIIAVIVLG